MGLVPMKVAVWGPFILLNFENGVLSEQESDFDLVGNEWLGTSSQILADGGVDSSLSFLCRREYTIECNWKVSSNITVRSVHWSTRNQSFSNLPVCSVVGVL